jgi:hypothetical protein
MKALLVAAFAISTSLGCQPAPPVVRTSWTSDVQTEITKHITVRDPDKVRSLIPYDSISIERTPCFGKCPVYKMTFHRAGKALLVDDHLRPDEARRYSAEIDLKQYARIAQFTEIARRATDKEEYMGQWTDDYSVRITATHSNGSWTVVDYGQVAPPELWALEQVLLRQYDTLPWASGFGQAQGRVE